MSATNKKAKKKPAKKKAKWACPECGMDHTGKHKRTLQKSCQAARKECGGFVCECEDATAKGHGDTLEDPCPYAVCYHCDWAGQFPLGKKVDYKYLYACKVAEAEDYKGYLEFILKFFKESWEELPNQEDTDPCQRFGDFCPENSDVGSRNWCPGLIDELGVLLEPGTEWAPAKIDD